MENKYKKEHTYLVLDCSTNDFIRWNGDNTLFFAGSKEDALIDLDENLFKAIPVSECLEDIQKEYEKRIDECIINGEI
jgi:hypothetical protein